LAAKNKKIQSSIGNDRVFSNFVQIIPSRAESIEGWINIEETNTGKKLWTNINTGEQTEQEPEIVKAAKLEKVCFSSFAYLFS